MYRQETVFATLIIKRKTKLQPSNALIGMGKHKNIIHLRVIPEDSMAGS